MGETGLAVVSCRAGGVFKGNLGWLVGTGGWLAAYEAAPLAVLAVCLAKECRAAAKGSWQSPEHDVHARVAVMHGSHYIAALTEIWLGLRCGRSVMSNGLVMDPGTPRSGGGVL